MSKNEAGTDEDRVGVSRDGTGMNLDGVRVSDGLRATEKTNSNCTCRQMRCRTSPTVQVDVSWRSKTGQRYPGKRGRSGGPVVPPVFRSSRAEAYPIARRQAQGVPLPLACMAEPLSEWPP